MSRKVKVIVTDEAGTVMDMWEVEVKGRNNDVQQARRAVIDLAERMESGVE